MLVPMVMAELTKVLVGKLSELKAEDAAKVLAALRRSTGGPASLVPGLGALGVGIVVGAGIGVLIAPRRGAETRAALRDSLRNKLGALRGKFVQSAVSVEEVVAREPNGQTGPAGEPKTASN